MQNIDDKGEPASYETSEADLDQLKRRSVHGAAATLISQAVKFCINFTSQIILARMLGPTQFGIVAMVAPVLGFIQVFADLGLMQAVIQRAKITHAQLNALFWMTVMIGGALALLAAASAPLVAWIYGNPQTAKITLALSLPIFLSGLGLLHTTLLNRHMRFVALATADIGNALVGIVVSIGCAFHGYGVWSLVYGQIAGALSNLIMVWVMSDWRPSKPALDPEIGDMMKTGLHVSSTNLISYLNWSFDNMLVGICRGATELGIYDRAFRLVMQPLGQIIAPFGRVAIPLFARLVGNENAYRAMAIRLIQVLLFAAMPGIMTVMVASKLLVLTLLGPQWVASAPIISWLCFGCLMAPLNNSFFWLLISQGRTKEQMRWGGGAMLFNILSYAIGIPWGILGVASLSAACTYVIQTPMLAWAVTRSGPIGPKELKAIVKPFFAPIPLCALATYEALQHFSSPSIWHLILLFIVAYAGFAVGLAAFPSGRMLIQSAWQMRHTLKNRG